MPRRRASMREGPLAELFRATEAAQRQAEKEGRELEPDEQPGTEQQVSAAPAEAPAEPKPTPVEPPEQTVEHVPEWEEAAPPPPPPPQPTTVTRMTAVHTAIRFVMRRIST